MKRPGFYKYNSFSDFSKITKNFENFEHVFIRTIFDMM